MRLVILLVLLAAGAAVLVWFLRRSNANVAPPAPVDPFEADEGRVDPRQIKVGDIVSIDGSDSVVRGTLRFDQSGFMWQEHFIDDVRNRRWLSVEDDEGLELCLWEPHAPGIGEPGAPEMVLGGVSYQLTEHGAATFTSEGRRAWPHPAGPSIRLKSCGQAPILATRGSARSGG